MTPAPPALVGHIAGELAHVAVSLGDRSAAARMRERAHTSLAGITQGQNVERNEVLQLLAPE